jgi:hypothetical protein
MNRSVLPLYLLGPSPPHILTKRRSPIEFKELRIRELS